MAMSDIVAVITQALVAGDLVLPGFDPTTLIISVFEVYPEATEAEVVAAVHAAVAQNDGRLSLQFSGKH